MFVRLLLCATICLGAWACTGCSKGVEPRTIKVKTPALEEARGILDRYAKGGPVGSEIDSVSELVGKVKDVDPDKAAMLEEAFNKIKDSPRNRAAIAMDALKKL